jgi:hypothetical protein
VGNDGFVIEHLMFNCGTGVAFKKLSVFGSTDYIPHTFPLGFLTIIITKIFVTANHFEIVFKFSSSLLRRVIFMYGICLGPAQKMYIKV